MFRLFYFLIFFPFQILLSQFFISGTVLDSQSKISIISANVVIYENESIVTGISTNTDGFFNIELNMKVFMMSKFLLWVMIILK